MHGDLYLYQLVPLGAQSVQVCLKITQRLGTKPILLAAWPKSEIPDYPISQKVEHPVDSMNFGRSAYTAGKQLKDGFSAMGRG